MVQSGIKYRLFINKMGSFDLYEWSSLTTDYICKAIRKENTNLWTIVVGVRFNHPAIDHPEVLKNTDIVIFDRHVNDIIYDYTIKTPNCIENSYSFYGLYFKSNSLNEVIEKAEEISKKLKMIEDVSKFLKDNKKKLYEIRN